MTPQHMHTPLRFRCARNLCATLFAVFTITASPMVQAGSTLDKITQTGSVTLGFREAAAPFAFLDENRQPVGYSIDICLKVVDALKRELKRSDIAIKYLPVLPATRISAIKSGDVDLECGSTTSNVERRKEVAFTVPTFIAASRLMVRKDSPIRSTKDLLNKTVVTTQGTNSEKFFIEFNATRGLGAKLALGKDHNACFAMLESGQADAFIMDDILLYTLRAASKNPDQFEILRDALTVEPLSIMLTKDDPAFKKIVDTEVKRLITQGEIYPLYKKWFESPIPPKQFNLNMPMSYLLRDSFKMPTDWLPI